MKGLFLCPCKVLVQFYNDTIGICTLVHLKGPQILFSVEIIGSSTLKKVTLVGYDMYQYKTGES